MSRRVSVVGSLVRRTVEPDSSGRDGPDGSASEGDATMRFMIIVKANKNSEAGILPEEKLMAAMASYHENLVKAGALLDANGLQASSKGARIRFSEGKRTVIEGPIAETKELIAGYTIIRVKSKEEAIEWAERMPNPYGEGAEGEIEIRQLF